MPWPAWNPPTSVTIERSRSELRVSVMRDSRLQQRIVGSLVTLLTSVVLVTGWDRQSVGMRAFLCAILLATVCSITLGIQIESAEMTVGPSRLTYRYRTGSGNKSGQFSSTEIKEIDYGYGGKASPAGLHVRHGLLGHTCVLPNVTEDEAYRFRGLIMDDFPEFNNGLAAPDSLISLNLNKR